MAYARTFPKDAVVPDAQAGFPSLILEIMSQPTDESIGMNDVKRPMRPGPRRQHDEGPGTVTQLGLSHGEGFHHHVLTQLGAFLDYGLGMDGNSHSGIFPIRDREHQTG